MQQADYEIFQRSAIILFYLTRNVQRNTLSHNLKIPIQLHVLFDFNCQTSQHVQSYLLCCFPDFHLGCSSAVQCTAEASTQTQDSEWDRFNQWVSQDTSDGSGIGLTLRRRHSGPAGRGHDNRLLGGPRGADQREDLLRRVQNLKQSVEKAVITIDDSSSSNSPQTSPAHSTSTRQLSPKDNDSEIAPSEDDAPPSAEIPAGAGDTSPENPEPGEQSPDPETDRLRSLESFFCPDGDQPNQ